MIRFSVFVPLLLSTTTWGSALPPKDDKPVGIYGGDAITINEAPYMAALFKENYNEEEEYFCGGSIVHKYFILTSYDCYRDINPLRTRVLVGANNVAEKDGVFINVEKKICYIRSRFFNSDDICLLKLKEPIQFGAKVAKITLADDDFKLEDGAPAQVTGWGETDNPYYFGPLHQATVPIQEQDNCRQIYDVFTDNMICAGSPRQDVCWGDGGSPLTYKGIQIGLVSYGRGCANYASVYTRISSYAKWIHKTIINNLSY